MSVTGSRGTRTGDEVRDSTPTTMASFVTNPRIRRPKVAIPRRSPSPINEGIPLVEPRRDNTGDIGGLGQDRAGASGYEIGDALRRGDLMLAAVLPGQLFELLLELQPGKLAPFRTQVPEIRGPHFGHHARIGIG